MNNLDEKTVEGFGDEWHRFDQSNLSNADRNAIFEDYFAIFPWHSLPQNAEGADIGCGSGRWALLVAPRVGQLHCVDPSTALEVARSNLAALTNVQFHRASVETLPFPDDSLDFSYSLGVLHHVPDTAAAIHSVAAKLKPGAPFLVYLYYAFDNRPVWFRMLWNITNALRVVICQLPHTLRFAVSQVIATVIYWPLARAANMLAYFNVLPHNWPLAYYRDKDFYVMRTDALDRFGTRLERRFTRAQIQQMLEAAGFQDISFSHAQPYWCALAFKGK